MGTASLELTRDFSVGRTDFTIYSHHPKKTERFSFNERSMAAGHEEEDAIHNMKSICNTHIFSCLHKGLTNDDVGVAKGAVFQEDTAGSWFQNRRFP